MHIDLHLHTTCSDGTVPPEQLAVAARRAGLHAIAITDHDTTAGVERARAAAAARASPIVIAGIELTCSLGGAEVHLLGYGIDASHAALTEFSERIAAMRRERLGAMLERLGRLGIALEPGAVEVERECVAVGRPHVARALVRAGTVATVEEAFARFLAAGGPAYVPSRGPAVGDGIAAVARAGGLAVWAHPALQDARRFEILSAQGLAGVEALRPSVAPAASVALEQAARRHGLVVTGGSDWHGGTAPPLGSWYVTERHVGAFLERLGIEAG